MDNKEDKGDVVIMLIFYTLSYCRLYALACTHGSYDECPKHPTMLLPCIHMVRKDEIDNE